MSRIFRRQIWMVVAGAGFAGLVGCGGDPYGNFAEVTGTLTCNGKPAVGAKVIFTPNDAPSETGRMPGNPGPDSMAIVGEDGTFRLVTWHYRGKEQTDGALVGPHTVRVEPPMTTRPALTPGQAGLPPAELAEVKAELDAIKLYPPLECGTDQVTPAIVVVTADGENRFELRLEGPPPQKSAPMRAPGGKRTPGPPGT